MSVPGSAPAPLVTPPYHLRTAPGDLVHSLPLNSISRVRLASAPFFPLSLDPSRFISAAYFPLFRLWLSLRDAARELPCLLFSPFVITCASSSLALKASLSSSFLFLWPPSRTCPCPRSCLRPPHPLAFLHLALPFGFLPLRGPLVARLSPLLFPSNPIACTLLLRCFFCPGHGCAGCVVCALANCAGPVSPRVWKHGRDGSPLLRPCLLPAPDFPMGDTLISLPQRAPRSLLRKGTKPDQAGTEMARSLAFFPALATPSHARL